nr:hypothetical protein [uncultured Ottowia sp.]
MQRRARLTEINACKQRPCSFLSIAAEGGRRFVAALSRPARSQVPKRAASPERAARCLPDSINNRSKNSGVKYRLAQSPLGRIAMDKGAK